jgi:hypothetical protein
MQARRRLTFCEPSLLALHPHRVCDHDFDPTVITKVHYVPFSFFERELQIF